MTPLIETNWELFDGKENVDFKQMNGWISEDKSLINRLENKYGTINLEVLNEEETEYSDKELGFERVKGNLRKVFLKAQKNIVYAESFFSSKVYKVPSSGSPLAMQIPENPAKVPNSTAFFAFVIRVRTSRCNPSKSPT